MNYKKNKPFVIYKANKNITGSALQIDFNPSKKSVFIDCTNQKTIDRFDWDNKITFKLSSSDIAQILSVLRNDVQTIKLFHQPSKGEYKSSQNIKNTVVSFSKTQTGFSARISQQTTDKLKTVTINISKSEGVILTILLSKAIEEIYGW